PSEQLVCLSLSVAPATNFQMLIAFCRCSEGLSDVSSRSVVGSRPASLSG
ncbi:hypothetical protein A2U01_0114033, partial [Trifolium medium]|nr:hypothetical protein [Trifolium medium]